MDINISLDQTYNHYCLEYEKDSLLIEHRNYIEANNLGFGERPFHVVWRDLVAKQSNSFNFLEIGVYKGQILSLVKLLAQNSNKNCNYYGVTPLSIDGDKYSNYDSVDYSSIIQSLFQHYNLDFNLSKNIIKGKSTDANIKQLIKSKGLFDLVYVDGCHNYDCVVSDINLVRDITTVGSHIVFDDASYYKQSERGLFLGHKEVADAIRDVIELDPTFEEVVCVGHNRVFKRLI